MLTHEDCERIHEAALEVLRDTGVRVDDAAIAGLLLDAGATALPGGTIGIPQALVQSALAQCPREVRLADRRGKLWRLAADGDAVVVTGNALYIRRGPRARADIESADLAEFARIVDALRQHRRHGGHGRRRLPASSRDFVGLRVMAQHTAKHLRPCIYTPAGRRPRGRDGAGARRRRSRCASGPSSAPASASSARCTGRRSR